jgi:hypothetical protein
MKSGKSIVHMLQMRQALLTGVDGEHMLGDVRSELEAKFPPNPFLQVSFPADMECAPKLEDAALHTLWHSQ